MSDPRDDPRHAPEAPAVTAPQEISALVAALARPHASGGVVIERAAILASGSSSAAVLAWIVAHGGRAEVAASAPSATAGLHRPRSDGGACARTPPLRYVLPAGAV